MYLVNFETKKNVNIKNLNTIFDNKLNTVVA